MSINIINTEKDVNVRAIAEQLAIAARTAPKTRGNDVVHIAIVDGDELKQLAQTMKELAIESGKPFFERDANNLENSEIAILLGAEVHTNGLNPCSLCGFDSCEDKLKVEKAPCAFNSIDLGIAIGSLVSKAADLRVDNRIMYTVGQAALRLGMMDAKVTQVCGIPLSVKGKNIFFDRK